MTTRLYNYDPLKPHFYIVKLGFTRVYIIFLILLKNIDCEYSLEPPRRGGPNEYPQSMFLAEIWKCQSFFLWKFSVFGGKIFYIFECACFRNERDSSRGTAFPARMHVQPSKTQFSLYIHSRKPCYWPSLPSDEIRTFFLVADYL